MTINRARLLTLVTFLLAGLALTPFAGIYVLIPAFSAGVIAALGFRIRAHTRWLVVCALLGALVTAVFIQGRSGEGALGIDAVPVYTLCGAGVGFVCGLVCLIWRFKVANTPGPPPEPERTAAEQYAINENVRLQDVQIIEEIIPRNIEKGDFALVVRNYAGLAEAHTDLGLLHWRHGLDPRPDFKRAIAAYDTVDNLAHEHALPKNSFDRSHVYAMLFLMGRKTTITFEDEAYHRHSRWHCYQCCLVHALHDQPLDDYHGGLLEKYLSTPKGIGDRMFLTYFQLIGLRPGDQPQDALVKLAEANWKRRRRSLFFASGGPAFDGYGLMNDIYVDVYLAAVIKKIGWEGESIHRWVSDEGQAAFPPSSRPA